MTEVDDIIAHYGKKGMKWGVRKGRKSSKKSSAPPKPKAKDLSDAELRAAVNRMQMERQYNSLIGNKKSPNKAVTGFILGIGATAVKTALTALATQQVNTAIKKVTDTK